MFPRICELAFLRGYLLGDGTVCKNRIAFGTSSYDIASGIVYSLKFIGCGSVDIGATSLTA